MFELLRILLRCGRLLPLIFLLCAKALAAEPNRALLLNGPGDYAELPAGVLSNLKSATIELWLNFRDIGEPAKRAFNYGTPLRD
ncbi:MAG TPA: hypothetical protein VGR78_08915, partial [Verrucomicrobiae bacterium]|nr:hypothetical protein [Verrucomicrobiae bacterium]